MINNGSSWIFLIAVYILSTLWFWYRGYKAKKLCYEMKRTAGGLWSLATYIVCLYLIIGASNLLVPINNWVDQQQLSSVSDLTKTVFGFTPYVFVAVVVWIAVRLMFSKSPIKFNEQEKKWQQEERNKFREKLPKVLRRFVKAKVD
jgi:hypothetical protein